MSMESDTKRDIWIVVAAVALLFAVAEAKCQDLPDAPQPQKAHYFTFGHADSYKPLRTNRQVFASKTFIGEMALLWGGTAYDAYRSTHHPSYCAEGDLSYSPRAEIPAAAAISLTTFLLEKYVWKPLGAPSPIYAGIKHIRAGMSWRNCQ